MAGVRALYFAHFLGGFGGVKPPKLSPLTLAHSFSLEKRWLTKFSRFYSEQVRLEQVLAAVPAWSGVQKLAKYSWFVGASVQNTL